MTDVAAWTYIVIPVTGIQFTFAAITNVQQRYFQNFPHNHGGYAVTVMLFWDGGQIDHIL